MVFAIEAIELVKEFKQKLFSKRRRLASKTVRAVNGVSFKVKENEKFALVGPNGAGKTTLVKLLTGILSPTTGKALIEESPVEEKRGSFGLMMGHFLIYHRLNGFDNLNYFARLYGVKNPVKKIFELSEFLELKKWLFEFVENYSLGMKSKLALARAMIHDPKILFLDEPTLGLDPTMSSQIRKKIALMNKTVLLVTHNLEEAKELCDRIGLMEEGKLIKVFERSEFNEIEQHFLMK
jgi:ABC-2 type transport system ATP-binding protein